MVFTPGHTPGHVSLYLERSKVLVAGDALTSEEGYLNGPNLSMTLDIPTALQSIKKLAALEVDTIVCYHGGVVSDDATGQLQRVLRKPLTMPTRRIDSLPSLGTRSPVEEEREARTPVFALVPGAG